MEKFKFVGDWAELADKWGIPHDEDDDKFADEIGNFVFKSYNQTTEKIDPSVKQDMYDFLDALINHDSHDKPMYQAMKDLDNDWSLTMWFSRNLRYLWE